MISIVQQVQSVSAQSGNAQSDSAQSKRGRGDFENHVEDQRKRHADDVSSKSVERQSDTENERSAVNQAESAEPQNDATDTPSDRAEAPSGKQEAAKDQTSDDPQAQPDESDFVDSEADAQAENTDVAVPLPAEVKQNPVVATVDSLAPPVSSENAAAAAAIVAEVSSAGVIATSAPTLEGGLAAGQPQESATEATAGVVSVEAAATDPLVGLATSQSTPVQQAPLAALAQAPQGGARRPAQGAEMAQPTIKTDIKGDETAEVKLVDHLKLKAGAESLRAELAASQVESRTPTAAPAVPVPTWGTQPAGQSTRPATPSASGLMTAGGALTAPNALGAALTAAVSDEAGVGLSAQLAGVSFTAERDSDMIALPQMLAEASVRAGSSTAHRDGTPRLVAVQLAEAAMQGKPKVDVVLNPQELGNVTMRLSTTENGIAMVIQAERPETEELMRRHIHELEKEFKEMGFDNIEFSFAGSGTEHSDTSEGGSGEAGDTLLDGDALLETEQETALIGGHLNLAAEVLDMRV